MTKKFYTSIEARGNNVLYRGYENGMPIERKIPYKPHLFTATNEETPWKSFSTGRNVKRKDFESISEFKDFIKKYDEIENFKLYGCENIVRQYTANEFRGDIDWDYKQMQIWLFDIETKAEGGFPKPELAQQEILLITMMNHHSKKIYTWSTQAIDDDNPVYEYDIDFRLFDTEKDMLKDFLLFWSSTRIDVISGWNSERFDIPYIVNRIKNILSEKLVNMLSPWGDVRDRLVHIMNDSYVTYDILGIAHLDYLDIYKKFTPGQKESFKLDFIAEIELGKNKLEMPGESFKDNYTYHWQQFVHYNVIDVHLLHELESKLFQIRLAMQVAFMAKVNFDDVISAMRIWESIIYSYFLDEGIVEDLKKKSNERVKIVGAYVHDPKPGKRGWVISIDATSLYPSIMMQNNISPECVMGMIDMSIDDMVAEKHVGTVDDGIILSANGLVTSKEKEGFIPILVRRMFDLRKMTKTNMLDLKKNNAPEEEYKALDVAQNAFKIAANSFYGITALPHFKYYDYRMAEAITSTGQVFIKKTKQYVDDIFTKLVGKEMEYAFYCDTDSVYIDVDAFVKKTCAGKTDQEIVDYLENLIFKVVQPTLNKKLDALAKTMGIDDCRISFKLECIGNGYIQVAKKRYVFDILYSEGVRYQEPKMKVMGIEIVRSSTPSIVKDYLKKAVKLCLSESESNLQKYVKTVKQEFLSQPYTAISFPRGCNGLTTYSNTASIYEKGCPIHVRAALLHNHHLKKNNLDTKYPLIAEGDKIKFVALKMPNPIFENVIGFQSKLPSELKLDQYVDYGMQFEKAFLSPLETILETIGWDAEEKVTLDFD